jgi:hypothetical protein
MTSSQKGKNWTIVSSDQITVYSLISGHHRSHRICPLKRGVHLRKFVRLIEAAVSEEKNIFLKFKLN